MISRRHFLGLAALACSPATAEERGGDAGEDAMISRRPIPPQNRGRGVVPQGGSSVEVLAVGTALLDYTAGQFNRVDASVSCSVTYLTSATAVSSAGIDVFRPENRGDGYGAVYLFEKRRINVVPRTQQLDLASWANLSTPTVTADSTVAPDGTTTADTISFNAVSNSARQYALTAANVASSSNVTISCWSLAGTGSKLWKFGLQDKSAVTFFSSNITATATWVRSDWTHDSGAGAGNPLTKFGTADSTAHDVIAWGYQFEVCSYPTSYISNTSNTQNGIGSEDVLQYLASQVPARLLTGKWSVNAYPYYANTDLVSGDVFWLFSFGSSSDGVRLRHNGASVKLEAVVGGAVIAASNALTFSRHAQLACTIDCALGIVTVNGSAGPTGSAVTFPQGILRVGGIVTGNSEFNGRLEAPKAA